RWSTSTRSTRWCNISPKTRGDIWSPLLSIRRAKRLWPSGTRPSAWAFTPRGSAPPAARTWCSAPPAPCPSATCTPRTKAGSPSIWTARRPDPRRRLTFAAVWSVLDRYPVQETSNETAPHPRSGSRSTAGGVAGCGDGTKRQHQPLRAGKPALYPDLSRSHGCKRRARRPSRHQPPRRAAAVLDEHRAGGRQPLERRDRIVLAGRWRGGCRLGRDLPRLHPGQQGGGGLSERSRPAL